MRATEAKFLIFLSSFQTLANKVLAPNPLPPSPTPCSLGKEVAESVLGHPFWLHLPHHLHLFLSSC